MRLVLAGLVIGGAGAAAASSFPKGMLFHVKRAARSTVGAVAIPLMLGPSVLLACYLPAREAAS